MVLADIKSEQRTGDSLCSPAQTPAQGRAAGAAWGMFWIRESTMGLTDRMAPAKSPTLLCNLGRPGNFLPSFLDELLQEYLALTRIVQILC